MQYVKKHAVYEKVTMSQCWKETGKNLIKTGWADTNKGTSPDLFSATSPLEGVKLGSSVKQPEGDSALFYAKVRPS